MTEAVSIILIENFLVFSIDRSIERERERERKRERETEGEREIDQFDYRTHKYCVIPSE